MLLFLFKFLNLIFMIAAFPFAAIGFILGFTKDAFISGYMFGPMVFKKLGDEIAKRSRFL